ncbi:anthrone oxygenase family protein [Umezawaea beigongshangensis]|uniref:anthrone oxygenase family protein n=1 Tax=Umezawaea beigongshangensis TaxID=2780383 RepID=UPI0027DCB548|nr:anthrone oxygenase family protein [Umezawaea beigongshangensis]
MLTTGALIAATVATGVLAGVFHAFSTSVMPGLARTDDRTFVVAMQRMNVAILNGRFLLGFLGAPLLTALAAVLHGIADDWAATRWIAVALVLLVVETGITVAVNVPMNNRLDAAEVADATAARAAFESGWVRWNTVRTVVSVCALLCLVVALAR